MCHSRKKTNRLFIDDDLLFSGDEISIGVIYNNLLGESFTGKSHAAYISRMRSVTPKLRTGTLNIKDERENIIKNKKIILE